MNLSKILFTIIFLITPSILFSEQLINSGAHNLRRINLAFTTSEMDYEIVVFNVNTKQYCLVRGYGVLDKQLENSPLVYLAFFELSRSLWEDIKKLIEQTKTMHLASNSPGAVDFLIGFGPTEISITKKLKTKSIMHTFQVYRGDDLENKSKNLFLKLSQLLQTSKLYENMISNVIINQYSSTFWQQISFKKSIPIMRMKPCFIVSRRKLVIDKWHRSPDGKKAWGGDFLREELDTVFQMWLDLGSPKNFLK